MESAEKVVRVSISSIQKVLNSLIRKAKRKQPKIQSTPMLLADYYTHGNYVIRIVDFCFFNKIDERDFKNIAHTSPKACCLS